MMKAETGAFYKPRNAKDCRPSPEAGEAWSIFSLKLSERTNSTDTLISNFQPPRTVNFYFYCFKPPSLWYSVMVALGN